MPIWALIAWILCVGHVPGGPLHTLLREQVLPLALGGIILGILSGLLLGRGLDYSNRYTKRRDLLLGVFGGVIGLGLFILGLPVPV